jgi:5-dehydro-2-deoxygluconokinase
VTETPTPEVLTIGRVSVDLYPEQIGVPLTEVRTFRKMLGGSPTNVAVAAARLGRRSAVLTKVGTDGFGDYVRAALVGFGVDASFVGTDERLRTPLAFCEIHPPDDFPLLFYREPTAPDLQLTDADLAAAPVEHVPLLWMTGTGLSEEPSRSATLAALRRRGRRVHTVFDLDYRPMLWREDPAPFYREAASYATVLVGNRDEWAVLGEAPEGVDVAIEKLGREGVRGSRGGESVVVPPIEVDVVNGLGAGDAFGGALCHGLLAGWELERVLRFSNAAGALVASRLGCADEMPSLAEVELLCAA